MDNCECPLCGVVDASCYNITTDCYQCPSCENTARLLTRKEQALYEAAVSGQNMDAVMKREQAIEQLENERRIKLFQLAV